MKNDKRALILRHFEQNYQKYKESLGNGRRYAQPPCYYCETYYFTICDLFGLECSASVNWALRGRYERGSQGKLLKPIKEGEHGNSEEKRLERANSTLAGGENRSGTPGKQGASILRDTKIKRTQKGGDSKLLVRLRLKKLRFIDAKKHTQETLIDNENERR